MPPRGFTSNLDNVGPGSFLHDLCKVGDPLIGHEHAIGSHTHVSVYEFRRLGAC